MAAVLRHLALVLVLAVGGVLGLVGVTVAIAVYDYDDTANVSPVAPDAPIAATTPTINARTIAPFGKPGPRTAPRPATTSKPRSSAAKAGAGRAELGSKLDFVFGRATGNRHNIERSIGMENQLRRVGIFDTPAGRAHVQQHLDDVLGDASNIARTQANGRTVRESLLMGPRGGLKVESVWDDQRLVTVILRGGRR